MKENLSIKGINININEIQINPDQLANIESIISNITPLLSSFLSSKTEEKETIIKDDVHKEEEK